MPQIVRGTFRYLRNVLMYLAVSRVLRALGRGIVGLVEDVGDDDLAALAQLRHRVGELRRRRGAARRRLRDQEISVFFQLKAPGQLLTPLIPQLPGQVTGLVVAPPVSDTQLNLNWDARTEPDL